MAVAIIRKAFKNQDKPGPKPLFYTSNLDKFLLKAFNKLSYNYKVSGPLVVRFLLDLPTSNASVKSINISVLRDKFSLLISGQNYNTTNNVACINDGKIPPYFIFEHYSYRGLCFLKLSLY